MPVAEHLTRLDNGDGRAIPHCGVPDEMNPIAVTETGGHWGTPVKIAVPSALGPVEPVVSAISCASPGNCAVAGALQIFSTDFGNSYAVVISETHGAWDPVQVVSGTTAPKVADTYATTNSVSCASPGDCAAGGFYESNATTPQRGFLVNEVGGHWGRALTLPGPQRHAVVDSVSRPAQGSWRS